MQKTLTINGKRMSAKTIIRNKGGVTKGEYNWSEVPGVLGYNNIPIVFYWWYKMIDGRVTDQHEAEAIRVEIPAILKTVWLEL